MNRDQLIALVQGYAQNYGVNPAIAVEQIRRESANFRSDVVYGPFVGGAGERGMSQFTPGTWQRFGSGPHTNAYDPDQAMTAWGKYMSSLLRMFGGNYEKALQGYNGGEGNVQRNTVSSAAKRYAQEILARAGATPTPSTDDGWQYGGWPEWRAEDEEETSLLPFILIGSAALLLIVLLND